MSTVISLDGPTSSGKSSVGFLFSKKIGFAFIDSGSIYRAATIAVINQNISVADEDALVELFKSISIECKEVDGKIHTFLDGDDVSETLHDQNVTLIVPLIAALPKVREEATWIQREIASREDTVLAGRDIGTVIYPHAKIKYYLTADIQVRANRRLAQLKLKVPNISYEQVLEEMIERDKKDMIRKVSPLRIPDGAIIIDTTNHTTEESVELMLEHYRTAK